MIHAPAGAVYQWVLEYLSLHKARIEVNEVDRRIYASQGNLMTFTPRNDSKTVSVFLSPESASRCTLAIQSRFKPASGWTLWLQNILAICLVLAAPFLVDELYIEPEIGAFISLGAWILIAWMLYYTIYYYTSRGGFEAGLWDFITIRSSMWRPYGDELSQDQIHQQAAQTSQVISHKGGAALSASRS